MTTFLSILEETKHLKIRIIYHKNKIIMKSWTFLCEQNIIKIIMKVFWSNAFILLIKTKQNI